MVSVLPLLTLLSLAVPEGAASRSRGPGDAPSLERLHAVRLVNAPDDVVRHPAEERGFVTVPMDYQRPGSSPKLRIFYRLMPVRGGGARDPRAPILVVVNGGPGAPSSIYRPYDYDEQRAGQAGNARDQLGALSAHFRILMADQRGTPGHSTRLDMSDPRVDPALVAQYFDSLHHALDLQEVIRAVIPADEPFYMLAQSYAGLIGVRYLTRPEITRMPAGLVLASATLPNADAREAFLARRRAQRALNLQLRKAVPEIEERLGRLAAHFREEGLDPGNVNHLWWSLGRGPAGIWEAALRDEVRRLEGADGPALRAFVQERSEAVDLLNYILSAKELTPGYTDRTLAPVLVSGVPFEPWMIDEQWTLSRLGGDAAWVGSLLDTIDRAPPPLLPAFPPMARMKELMSRTRLLFTLGEGDAFVDAELGRRNAEALVVPGKMEVRLLPGGHKAAFLPPGAAAVAAWAGAR